MIEAKELRVGNLLNFNNGEEMSLSIVDSITTIDYNHYLTRTHFPNTVNKLDKFEPIPLTEEWLVKFGFEKVNWGKELKYRLNEIEIFKTDNSWRLNIPYHLVIVKYVHRLQNLCYELGEELTIKE